MKKTIGKNDRSWFPFDDLRLVLNKGQSSSVKKLFKGQVQLDVNRIHRTHIPEVVRAANKNPMLVAKSLVSIAEINGRSLAYKCSETMLQAIKLNISESHNVILYPVAHVAVVSKKNVQIKKTGGRVGIISAGSSDIPIAEEAAIMATEMGAAVTKVWDVGISGLHRLIHPLENLIREGVDVIIVVAGMEGALAPVVAGLVPVPVIGLPTSTGDGFGGQGLGALTTMLQSCSLNLTVVNIDNGIRAGAIAALIANEVGYARTK